MMTLMLLHSFPEKASGLKSATELEPRTVEMEFVWQTNWEGRLEARAKLLAMGRVKDSSRPVQ